MQFPWQKRPIKQAPAIDGGALRDGWLYDAAVAEYNRQRRASAFHNQLHQTCSQNGEAAPLIQPTIVALPEDAPASEIFERMEAHPGYGEAFKRIMRDISLELEAKDKRIRDLESQLETAGELWTQNYSN